MNRDPSTQQVNPGNNHSEEYQESIYPDQHEYNIADGGEFLDDGIRMKEQPYGESHTSQDQ